MLSNKREIEINRFAGKWQISDILDRTAEYNWFIDLLVCICTVIVATAVSWPLMSFLHPLNIIMVYLLAIVFVASYFNRRAAIFTSLISIAAYDYFFVDPPFCFVPSDSAYLFTYVVMLIVALIISEMAYQIRQQINLARQNEQEMSAVYKMSRDFVNSKDLSEVLLAGTYNVSSTFACAATILLLQENGRLERPKQLENVRETVTTLRESAKFRLNDSLFFDPQYMSMEPGFDLSDRDLANASWCCTNKRIYVPLTADELHEKAPLCVPLIAANEVLGVLALKRQDYSALLKTELLGMLEAFGNQIASAILRVKAVAEMEHAQTEVEVQRLKNTLLSSVSHDLRTPLASIVGAASNLLEYEKMDKAVKHEMIQSIYNQAIRLNDHLRNLLSMTRLEAGKLNLNKDWHSIEEIVGAALNVAGVAIANHNVAVEIPEDFPLLELDDSLIEQVFINLLENAAKYTPNGSMIWIKAAIERSPDEKETTALLEFSDNGPGLPAGQKMEEKIFEKFYRAGNQSETAGVGLGLAICQAIVKAHGGMISAKNREGGGLSFYVALPVSHLPPSINRD